MLETWTSLIVVGHVPLDTIPRYLAAVDIVALPQKRTWATEGQMPAKLTDAMAMGKTIIASDTADIPLYLEDRGFIFRADDKEDLKEKLLLALDMHEHWQEIGSAAREYFLDNLSNSVVARKMKERIDRILDPL